MARSRRRQKQKRISTPFASQQTPVSTSVKQTQSFSQINWSKVAIVIAIFLFALYLRTAWNLEPATEDGFQLTGGSDPYYHKHVIDYVHETGKHLISDPMLNYPLGANNVRPPLFDWSIVIAGLLISPIVGNQADAIWWATEIMPAVYGALLVFPIYAMGRTYFGSKAALFSAFFISVSASHIGHSTLALADHDSFIILLTTICFYFFMKSLSSSEDKRWVSNWKDIDSIKEGFSSFFSNELLSIGYAGLAGTSLLIVALSWKGFPYLMAIVAIYLVLQMLINSVKKVDSFSVAMVGIIALSVPIILSFPYYYTMGSLSTWWEAPAYILLGVLGASLIFVPTRDLPWLLVWSSTITAGLVGFLLLQYVFTELGFLLLGGQGYFIRTNLSDTIAEAQPPSFSNFIFSFGIVTAWLAIFGLFWLSWKLFNDKSWKKDHFFLITWAAVSIFMAQSAVRFIFNATPIMVILSGWITASIVTWSNFDHTLKTLRIYWGRESWNSQLKFRDRLGGLRKAFHLKQPFMAFMITAFLILPNAFHGYDAAIPYETKKEHDVGVYDLLTLDFLRPDEWEYDSDHYQSGGVNYSKYPEGVSGMYNKTTNDLWYLGTTGASFPSDYWIEGLEWLSEQDAYTDPTERPAFLAWWDYGFWSIDIAEHPTVADNFQFGYQIAGNFLAAQSEKEALSLMLYRLLEAEVDRHGTESMSIGTKQVLQSYYSDSDISSLEHIISNPKEYIPENEDINKENAAIRAATPILMSLSIDKINEVLWKVEEETGNSIRYFAADRRMMPFSYQNTGILYAPITLADYNVSDYIEVVIDMPDGERLTIPEVEERIMADPSFQIPPNSESLVYKDKFLNSMFYRAFIGWSGLDVGGSADDGIPAVMGDLANEAYSWFPSISGYSGIAPGWNLTHFKLVESNSGLRILKYYEGANVTGSIKTSSGEPIAGARITAFDEYRIPHATVQTDSQGDYSILVPAGEINLVVSLGEPNTKQEKALKVSNTILSDDVILSITEAEATRQGDWTIEKDIILDSSSISGKIYWDENSDFSYDEQDESLSNVTVVLENLFTEETSSVLSDENGNYSFSNIAPGEYVLTGYHQNHEMIIQSYRGQSAIKAGQSLDSVDGAWAPLDIFGAITFDSQTEQKSATFSLLDHTNDLTTVSDFDSLYQFDHLLPGNYTLRLLSEDMATDWINNTLDIQLTNNFEPENITISHGKRIEGSVLLAGVPEGDASVALHAVDGSSIIQLKTDVNGYFTDIVIPQQYYLKATLSSDTLDGSTIDHSGHGHAAIEGDVVWSHLEMVDMHTYDSPVFINLKSAVFVEGYVYLDSNGNGVLDSTSSTDESLSDTSEDTVIDVLLFESVSTKSVTTAYSDGNGRYSLYLPPDSYYVYSVYSGSETQEIFALLDTITVTYGDDLTNSENHFDLPFYPASSFNFLTFEKLSSFNPPSSGLFTFENENGKVSVWSDMEDGEGFNFVLPYGSYSVGVDKYGYQVLDPVTFTTPNSNLEVFIGRIPTYISGQFIGDNQPLEGMEVKFSSVTDPISNTISLFTDSNGWIGGEILPDSYTYEAILDLGEGVRYSAEGDLTIDLNTDTFDLGSITTETLVQIYGNAWKTSEFRNPVVGDVEFRSKSSLDTVFTFHNIGSVGQGYSGYVPPGMYYVTFSPAHSHHSYLNTMYIENPQEHNLILEEEFFLYGGIRSKPTGLSLDFDNDVEVFLSSVDGTMVLSTRGDYNDFGIPKGTYTVSLEVDGYEFYESELVVSEDNCYSDGGCKFDIRLIPDRVSASISFTYIDSEGVTHPLSDVEVVLSNSYMDFTYTGFTDSFGSLPTFEDIIPARYYVDIDYIKEGQKYTLNDNFKIEVGVSNQQFTLEADWKIRIGGALFYDRDFDAIPDSNELFPEATIEIWDDVGEKLLQSINPDSSGNYEFFLSPQNVQLYAYVSDNDNSFVFVENIVANQSHDVDITLSQGIHYMATYLNSDTNTPLNFSESLIVLSSSELTLNLLAPDGILDVILPAGEYTISSDLEDHSYVPSVIFVLDETINLSIADGSIQNTISLDPILLRGLEISHGELEAYALIGEGASFTFYLKNLGESSEEYDIYVYFSNEAQSGWSSTINPVHVNIMSNQTEAVEILITPDLSVAPGSFIFPEVEIVWDGIPAENQEHGVYEYELRVTASPPPISDFSITEVTWLPEQVNMTDIDMEGFVNVTLTATIFNNASTSLRLDVPIAFYVNDAAIALETATFDDFNFSTVSTTIAIAAEFSEIRLSIDPGNAFTESDKSNNNYTFSITATPAPVVEESGRNWSQLVVAAIFASVMSMFILRRLRK
ncbi:MAG: hypothetical protein BEU04_02615 [Marine Group III euryarchaeote CG-Bathy1]|uniref:dolichyl-phosphooligosaccharide-protein glycotransferase n=1 Tax=Marine Group III euryarchaeote CG-Bathy1 TaxID=1889001 RepID=A0A1J5TF30_9ARCH|nr:MAG: hypothetical protein BEU04_02615 [Marine Group III euryarchaeote CG-Bathy1]